MRKMPIGVQTFDIIREDNYAYVDKTEYIYRLVDRGRVYFLSRPRRFGKSLFLSTLKAYFLGRKDLFDNTGGRAPLKIAEYEQEWKSYPVFHLDMNAGNFNSVEGLTALLNAELSRLEDLWGADKNETRPPQRFAGVIRRAAEKSGKKAAVLIDEYDKPLLQLLEQGKSSEDILDELKAFYGVLKSADQYLQFVFLTGVTRFSRISVFSDLNQLRDISMEDDFSSICGITQDELVQNFDTEIKTLGRTTLADYDETIAKLQKSFNGYHFVHNSEGVYNPFSVLNTFAKNKFDRYWFATGTPAFLINELKRVHYYALDFKENVKVTAKSLGEYRMGGGNVISLLYQSGYLTINDYDDKTGLYKLAFPNEEVMYGFLENLLPSYIPSLREGEGFLVTRFYEALQNEDIGQFMEILKSFLASIPYDLNYNKDEKYYQTVFYLIFTLLGQWTEAEVRSARGRSDAVVKTGKTIYIFEFKMDGSGSAADALAQIQEKEYAAPYKTDRRNIVAVGVCFDRETRNIREWKTSA
jgi:hypothetical protein